ncbi:MAG: DUF3429 domain-containing protein [Alphaproteobacteria bacterium]|nr:DUF3429 domain-containing protein [Alphaproteobacteria bacterium]
MSPKMYSYLGTAPFIILMLSSFAASTENAIIILNVFYSALSSLSLAFLAGAHWGQAVPSNNFGQYKVAIYFLMAIFASFVLTFILSKSSLPMLLYAGLFWLMYYMDKRYLPADSIPDGYFAHRYKLTMIVSVCLVITALT